MIWRTGQGRSTEMQTAWVDRPAKITNSVSPLKIVTKNHQSEFGYYIDKGEKNGSSSNQILYSTVHTYCVCRVKRPASQKAIHRKWAVAVVKICYWSCGVCKWTIAYWLGVVFSYKCGVMTTPLAQYVCTKWQQTLRSNTSLLVLRGGFKAVKGFATSCGYDERSFMIS